MTRKVVPVSTLIDYIKDTMDADPVLHGFMVEGEISNMRKPYSGHWYFSLKDESSSIPCVMFARSNQALSFPVNNGDKVIVTGDINIYKAEGRMQILVTNMKQSGLGELYIKFEQLKKKLQSEGYFDEAHKKPLPPYPMDIALVTGNNTAAKEDVLITFQKRWPIAKITEYATPVQGNDAPPKIIDALKKADKGGHELIMLVRGGGSIEDLWCFNDEALAKVIYDLDTPIITGIGHEIDFTLADYVSDVRANTPTGAVEHAVPDMHEVLAQLRQYRIRLETMMSNQLDAYSMKIDRYEEQIRNTIQIVSSYRQSLQHSFQLLSNNVHAYSSSLRQEMHTKTNLLERRMFDILNENKQTILLSHMQLEKSMQKNMDEAKSRFQHTIGMLDAYSPLKIMERGYGAIFKEKKPIKSIEDVKDNDALTIRLKDGEIQSIVQTRRPYNGKE